ncbi:hypothetical protein BaRGS_00006751 [Batillaria attramentaria]|uniref:Exoribonuclease phosphorolytic domain-containing protein n=1 Tax=Batillaria attramentaria TaxID=370345 RepID=A0ABD0LSN7_9CAEN
MESGDGSSKPSLAAMTCVLGDLSQPDGSAELTHGGAVVRAAVYGPCEVKMSKEILDKATIEVVFKPKVGLPRCEDKSRERLIHDVFEAAVMVSLHPRSSIMIVLQEMENAEGLMATGVNAACLALLDAGISMKFLVAAVVCFVKSDGSLDLSPETQRGQADLDIVASLTFVFSEKDLNIMCVSSTGKYSVEQYDSCLHLCREASKSVFKFFRESLERKLSKSI